MHIEELNLLEKNFRGEALFVEKGKFYIRQGNYALAIEELKKAIELNPNSELAHFEMGNTLVKIKNDAGAEREYKMALELNPRFAGAALELGRFYHYRQRRLDLAVENFKLVVCEEPGNWEAYLELGKIYKHKQQPLAAVDTLKRASALKPDNIQISFQLGKLYRDINLSDLAIEEFKKAYSIGDTGDDAFIKNKALNEIEITEKKLILESKVRAMVAMIINKCNVQCIMCNIWKTPWQASLKTMDEIVGLFPYIEDMVWEGGEVFLMKGFGDILDEAMRHKYLKQVIFTNGLYISEKLVEKLIRGKVDVVFSIEAATEETYEHIRRGGRFQRLLRNLSMVRLAKEKSGGAIETHFNSVIMKSNYREIEQLIDFAKEYNFNAITLTPIRGKFLDENIFEDNDTQALEYIRKITPRIAKKAYEYGIILNNWLPVTRDAGCVSEKEADNPCQGLNIEEGQSLIKNDSRMICYAPWQRMVIDNEGQVRPFVFCLHKWVGNTNKDSLQEIWNSQAMQEYRKKIIDCDYLGLCQPECISGQVADKIRDVV